MVFGTIIAGCLFILPAAVTTGVLVGLDAVRSSNNQKPIFTAPPGGGYGGGPGMTSDRGTKIETDMYCEQTVGVYPYVDNGYQQYTLNPNQWGWTQGTPGALCMNVTTYQNGSYPTKLTAPEWSVTWQYPQGPIDQPVHAFPNIKLNADKNTDIPLQISAVNKVEVDVEWYYGVGDDVPITTDPSALTAAQANTNVAIDMFLDDDKDKSTNPEQAQHEIMVWLAAFGPATQPIGYPTAVATATVNSVPFSLYYGKNGNGQTVMTWMVAANTIASPFNGDLSPLLKYDYASINFASFPALKSTDIPPNNMPPTSSAYIGYIGLGSEAYWSAQNLTLSVPHLTMEVSG